MTDTEILDWIEENLIHINNNTSPMRIEYLNPLSLIKEATGNSLREIIREIISR